MLSWAFDREENSFVGLGGAPQGNWLSVAPYIVNLERDDTILGLKSSFEFPEVPTNYWASPPEKVPEILQQFYPFPSLIQQSRC